VLFRSRRFVPQSSPVSPAVRAAASDVDSDTAVGGDTASRDMDIQTLRSQVQWLTDMYGRGFATPMHDVITDADMDHRADVDIIGDNVDGNNAMVAVVADADGEVENVAVPTEQVDKDADCYKGISVLEAYHKGDPVGRPVGNFLVKTVNKAFNSRIVREEREKIKNKYVAPPSVPYSKAPVINEAVRRNMSRFSKDIDDEQRRVQSDFSGAIVPILYAMQDINGGGEVDKAKVTEHLATALALIGDASYSMSCKRRERLKSSLSKEYKELCDEKVEITSQLLGDDCDKTIKKIKETTKAPMMASSFSRYYKKSSGSSHSTRGSGQAGGQRRFGDRSRGPQQSRSGRQSSAASFQGRSSGRRPWGYKRQYHN